MHVWNLYKEGLTDLEKEGYLQLPFIPEECEHNAHMFYIKSRDLEERTELISYLRKKDINAVFHYVPLHSSPAGSKFGRFFREDRYTTKESDRLIRLPLHYNLSDENVIYICEALIDFYKGGKR